MTQDQSAVGVARGAVLYDTRRPRRRPCCREAEGRCLAHVTSVYEDVDTGDRLYEVWDGTHTTREYHTEDSLQHAYDPAGWQMPTGHKPTYYLTREIGVHDNHDLMLEANR